MGPGRCCSRRPSQPPPGREQGLLAFALGSDGRGADLLACPMSGSRQPITAEGAARREQFMQMDGRAVFKWAIRLAEENIAAVVERAGLPLEQIDLFVLHQANARIIEGHPHGPRPAGRKGVHEPRPLRQHLERLDPAGPRRGLAGRPHRPGKHRRGLRLRRRPRLGHRRLAALTLAVAHLLLQPPALAKLHSRHKFRRRIRRTTMATADASRPVKTLPARKDVAAGDTWDLASLFARTEWEAALGLGSRIRSLRLCRHARLVAGAAGRVPCLRSRLSIAKGTDLGTYAYLRAGEDQQGRRGPADGGPLSARVHPGR